jgi:hypothetical protein
MARQSEPPCSLFSHSDIVERKMTYSLAYTV